MCLGIMAFSDNNLNSHKRKHDVDLHLGIDQSSSTIEDDETPTPTRFIRNCEEVGLFQDLQNVNPFEETFRKATELANSGTLHLPEASSDDSLHTPHIFPNIEEFSVNSAINETAAKLSEHKSGGNSKIEHSVLNIVNVIPLTTSAVINDETTIKLKLKEALKNRNRVSESKIDDIEYAAETILGKDTYSTKVSVNNSNVNKCKDKNVLLKLRNLEKKRETNRAAQIRSRERKKHQFRQLTSEVVLLRSEVKQLSKKNQKLKNEVLSLKAMLLYHKDCPVSRDPRVAEEINLLIKSAQVEAENKSKTVSVTKNLAPIQQTSSKFVALAPTPASVILQIPAQISAPILTAALPTPQLISTIPSRFGTSINTLITNTNVEEIKLNKVKEKSKLVKEK